MIEIPLTGEVTSVPNPSFARTVASEKIKSARPAFFAFATTDITVPFEPVNPGVGIPPLKVMAPVRFE